jgi:hypothetical protein
MRNDIWEVHIALARYGKEHGHQPDHIGHDRRADQHGKLMILLPAATDVRAHYTLAMAESDQEVVDALAAAWARIRRDKRVPKVVIDIGPGRSSSCTSVGWGESGSGDQPQVLELNLRPDGLNTTGPEVMHFLLHQAAHALAPPSPSTEGRYHGVEFRDAARKLGLEVKRAPGRGGTGWSETTLDDQARYAPEIRALARALRRWEPTVQPKAARSSSRNPPVAVCQCSPPRRIRVSETTLRRGPIKCGICRHEFTLAASL